MSLPALPSSIRSPEPGDLIIIDHYRTFVAPSEPPSSPPPNWLPNAVSYDRRTHEIPCGLPLLVIACSLPHLLITPHPSLPLDPSCLGFLDTRLCCIRRPTHAYLRNYFSLCAPSLLPLLPPPTSEPLSHPTLPLVHLLRTPSPTTPLFPPPSSQVTHLSFPSSPPPTSTGSTC